jgi:hypothetical protein
MRETAANQVKRPRHRNRTEMDIEARVILRFFTLTTSDDRWFASDFKHFNA